MDEDMWLKLGSALLLGMMVILLWPRAKVAMQEGRKGSAAEWKSVIIPLLAVVGFVILLILSV